MISSIFFLSSSCVCVSVESYSPVSLLSQFISSLLFSFVFFVFVFVLLGLLN